MDISLAHRLWRWSHQPGQPRETCVRLFESAPNADKKVEPKELLSKCAYGLVWMQSVRRLPRNQGFLVTVQPLSSWSELWLFHRDREGWRLDTLSPATVEPELGNIELAGISPDGNRLLLAREALVNGSIRREFQVVLLETLAVESQARAADRLSAFRH